MSSRCNADSDCVTRRPFCSDGYCRAASSCNADADCASGIGGRGCVNGTCADVDCVEDADCRSGQSCVAHECRDCVSSAQCGDHGVCTDNSCVCVECKRGGQCAFDQTCSAEHRCVDFCAAGQVFVTFAKQYAAKEDDVAGPGNGLIDIFSLQTGMFRRFATGSDP